MFISSKRGLLKIQIEGYFRNLPDKTLQDREPSLHHLGDKYHDYCADAGTDDNEDDGTDDNEDDGTDDDDGDIDIIATSGSEHSESQAIWVKEPQLSGSIGRGDILKSLVL